MKGIVFSKFLEFVEEQYDANLVDDMIELAALPSEGAYTSVGTYDHNEMLLLVTALSKLTDIPVPDLVRSFGRKLFEYLSSAYPQFMDGIDSPFQFLQSIENHIHVEVRKLYPDAELPSFNCEFPQAGQMSMTYFSKRPFADLALGLIEGCLAYFNQEIIIDREDIDSENGYTTRFLLTLKD